MELFKENLAGNILPNSQASQFVCGYLAFLMPGAAPTTPAQVKDAIDPYDIQDIYAKCLGVTQLQQLRGAVAENSIFTLAPNGTARTALKKGDFDYNVATATNNLIPADMRKASLPDRFFLCSKDAPFTRLSQKTGMAGANMMRDCPWQFYDTNAYGAVYAGIGAHADSIAAYVTEYEWDTPRNFGGVLRSSTGRLTAANGYTIIVEAWNGSAWETVLSSVAKAGAVAANYAVFSKRIVTSKLRIQTIVTGTFSQTTHFQPHGVIPLEVTADAPAAVAVADIGWAILVPMYGYNQTVAWGGGAGVPATFNDVAGPVPFLAAKAGIAGDAGAEFIMTKTRSLVSTDKPQLVSTKYLASTIKE